MREAAASKAARDFYLYKLELERKEKINNLIDETLDETNKRIGEDMTNPSERITKIANNLYNDNQEPLFYYTIDKIPSWIVLLAILSYLDEEQEKPKYVCPNCHRITDELITIAEIDNVRPDGSIMLAPHCVLKEQGFSSKAAVRCKHCLNKN